MTIRLTPLPLATGVDTPRCPDNGWLLLGPDNSGTFYFGVAFLWSVIQKDFLQRPAQRVANTLRRPGQRVVTLYAALDNRHALRADLDGAESS